MKKMKVLILGGTRYMGCEAARVLTNLGHQVITLSRSNNYKTHWEHIVCNRKNISDLEAVFKLRQPDLVLDMVCFDREDAMGIIELGELKLLDRVSHYLMVSTFFIYNYFSEREHPFVGDISSIVDDYTRRKAEAETLFNSSDFLSKMTMARLPYVFSRNDYTGRFQKFIEISLSSETISNAESFETSMVSMKDASHSLANILLGSPLGYVDIANDGCMKLGEIQNTIRRANGLADSPVFAEILNGPYQLTKNLCLRSKKWQIKKSLQEALEIESSQILS